MAATREASRAALLLRPSRLTKSTYKFCPQRSASTQTAEATSRDWADLESDSSLGAPQLKKEEQDTYRPWKNAGRRKYQLPASRYQYHPPKYNRGPLHPIQSPVSSDPVARDFVPGPFNIPRLRETYHSTVAQDLMTLTYKHVIPGTPKEVTPQRLRSWDDSSPYHKNRPLRRPRGPPVLKLLERDITFRNVPEITEVTISTYVPEAIKEPEHLLAARSALLAITGNLPEVTKTHSNVQQWHIRSGEKAGAKTTIYGNAAYEFLDRCIHLVFPRIKDWKGIKGTSGDGAGNVSWGFTSQELALFPEIEINYDMYPPKMLPGCRVVVKTTATSDTQARLLLQAMGIPFYGK